MGSFGANDRTDRPSGPRPPTRLASFGASTSCGPETLQWLRFGKSWDTLRAVQLDPGFLNGVGGFVSRTHFAETCPRRFTSASFREGLGFVSGNVSRPRSHAGIGSDVFGVRIFRERSEARRDRQGSSASRAVFRSQWVAINRRRSGHNDRTNPVLRYYRIRLGDRPSKSGGKWGMSMRRRCFDETRCIPVGGAH